MNPTYTRGSATSLIAILISVALIAWMFTKIYLTPSSNDQLSEVRNEIATGTPASTEIGRAQQDIQAAKAVQESINQHNKEVNSILGE